MPKPNQSANWDFKFNRKSPSQKKKEIYIYLYQDTSVTQEFWFLHDKRGATVETKKMYHKKCYRYIHLHNNTNRSDTNIVD